MVSSTETSRRLFITGPSLPNKKMILGMLTRSEKLVAIIKMSLLVVILDGKRLAWQAFKFMNSSFYSYVFLSFSAAFFLGFPDIGHIALLKVRHSFLRSYF